MMKNIAVIGAGTMGNGIAHVFAQHGFKVSFVDISIAALEDGMVKIAKNIDRQVKKGEVTPEQKQAFLAAITTFTDIAEGVKIADLVIEAVTENPSVKISVLQTIDQFAPVACIIASNTSSISITKLAAATNRADKFIGMHFMNPVPVMTLVEVISGYATSQATLAKIVAVVREIHKVALKSNDYPGFVANRILMPMINEAIYTLFEGVAGVEEIDGIMKLGMAHPMGPLQLADFIGLDVCLSILKVLHEGFGNPKYAPCPLLVNMVQAGDKGVKSGKGFYDYSQGNKELIVAVKRN
jgi:3-hydroxybutyryl-CoA dehydrogenase